MMHAFFCAINMVTAGHDITQPIPLQKIDTQNNTAVDEHIDQLCPL